MQDTVNTFVNWSENIKNTNVSISYPQNDNEIIDLINKASTEGKIIRVVGSSHSMSPVICSSDESNLLLVSLRDYHLNPEQGRDGDISIDHQNMIVTVNSGLRIADLYDQLTKFSYFLETQPASSAFTIGGIINMPVHGGRLGASLVADTIVGLTLIDMSGQKVVKTETDSDFDLYRVSLGLFGIITSVTFKIQKMENIKCSIKNYENIFTKNKVQSPKLDDFFKNLISDSLNSDPSHPHYNHSFLDFQNSKLLSFDWVPVEKGKGFHLDLPDTEKIKKLPADLLQHIFLANYREHPSYLRMVGKLVRLGAEASVETKAHEDNDMLWVSLGTRVYFMSYFIPVHTEGDPVDLSQLYKAFEIVKKQVTVSKKDKKKYNVDFPMDIRFVVSNNKSVASPLHNDSSKRVVYMAIDLTTGPSDLELLWDNVPDKSQPLNKDFREFYASVEQQWKTLGGRPHYSKMFGFGGNVTDPFNPVDLAAVFDPSVKTQLKAKAQPLFVNDFVHKLID
jgi:hypothetical protein